MGSDLVIPVLTSVRIGRYFLRAVNIYHFIDACDF
jgi:hypothetical protein